MPKWWFTKKKDNQEEKQPEIQPVKMAKMEQDIPVVNGVQTSLGWVPPLDPHNDQFYVPEDGFSETTGKNFTKVMKNYFGVDLEAAPQDALNRIYVTNASTELALQEYFKEMEENSLMPECQEKYKLREEIAQKATNALFYEMAKGGLAIIPLGEKEPRQIRCDKNKEVFTVTEPYSECFIGKVQEKYTTKVDYENVPAKPLAPKPPVFNEPEPTRKDPGVFQGEAPGKKPTIPNFRKKADPPVFKDILENKTEEQLAEEIFQKDLEQSGYKKPEPVPEDPGEFTMKVPDKPKDPASIVLTEPPEKPAACDTAEALEKEAEASEKRLDPKYYDIKTLDPGEFGLKEPKRPVLDNPEPVELELLKADKPETNYVFTRPVLKISMPKNITGQAPVLDVSDLEAPGEEPVLREEPPQVSGVKRFFRIFSSEWRRQIKDRDSWEEERRTYPKRLEEWERKSEAYDRIFEQRKIDYDRKHLEWLESQKHEDPDVQLENELAIAKYKEDLKRFEETKEELGSGLAAEKARFEKALKDWEASSPGIIEENNARREQFLRDSAIVKAEREEYLKNFEGCIGRPDLIAKRREELNKEYEKQLAAYLEKKAIHDEQKTLFDAEVRKCRLEAEKNGIDPNEAVEANRQWRESQKLSQILYEKVADYRIAHPEIGEYETAVQEYEDDKSFKESLEERMEEYEEEKKEYDRAKLEYDQKKEAFDDLKKANEHYDEVVKQKRINAKYMASKLIEENRRKKAEFPKVLEKYEYDSKIYDRDKAQFEENVKKMHEPGGLIWKWEQKKQKYEEDLDAYKKKCLECDNYNATLDIKKQAWQIKKETYEIEKQIYEEKKKIYEAECDRIDAIYERNREKGDKAQAKDMSNPKYKDFLLNGFQYNIGRARWGQKIPNYKTELRDKMDVQMDMISKKQEFSDYERLKKRAPKNPSSQEQQAYVERVKLNDELKKYPDGMKHFVAGVYYAGKEHDRKIDGAKDIDLKTYKEMALETMYYGVVKEKTDRYAKNDYFRTMNADPLSDLMDKKHKDEAIAAMKKNKNLMKQVEERYSIYSDDRGRQRSLHDEETFRSMYHRTYRPAKSTDVVVDPILGEQNKGTALLMK